MRLAAIAPLLAAALLAGCAHVSPAERAAFCKAVDWREFGANDGRLGVAAHERAEFFADCRELGHPPDVEGYRTGRAGGLKEYCTAEKGYEVGRQGRPYRDVCPEKTEVTFLQGYEEGREERGYHRYRYYPHYYLGFGHHYYGYHY